MAYYNYGYPQYYPQAQTPQPSMQPQQSGIVWVQGEAGAKSYMVAPGATVTLWDSESDVIYVKSADARGIPSMQVLDYKIRGNADAQQAKPEEAYITKTDLAELEKRLNQRLDELMKGVDHGESAL